MSTSLATLTADFFENLLQIISGNDLASLMMSGNRLLRHKLRLSCFEFRLETPSALFPFTALNLPKLRTLSVKSIEEAVTYLDFRKGGDLALTRGHKTLEKIELRFPNSPAFFISLNRSVPRLTIRDRFPMLSTLTLDEICCEKPLEGLFGEFPETLRKLSLTYTASRFPPRLCLASLCNLPAQLESLELSGFLLNDPAQRAFDFGTLFPANLRHLTLDQLAEATILDYWPPVLQTLRFSVLESSHTLTWRSSKIPPNLVELYVSASDWQFELDAPYPHTLKILDFPGCSMDLSEDNIANLPAGLTTVPIHFLRMAVRFSVAGRPMALESICKRLVHLEHMEIWCKEQSGMLPGGLKSLHLPTAFAIEQPLPSGLKNLMISAPHPLESLKHLPSTITTLHVRREESVILTGLFPPWNAAEVDYLTSRMLLTSFDIEMTSIVSGSCLASLKGVETLKILMIRQASPPDMLSSPNWLPHCLPENLEYLQISSSPQTRNRPMIAQKNDDIITDDFLRLCNLAKATPHLKTLIWDCKLPQAVLLGPSFASLPRGLLSLSFSFMVGDLLLDACSQLPRSLKRLELKLMDQNETKISNKHFEALPESLQQMSLFVGDPADLDQRLLEILPKSIAVFDLLGRHTVLLCSQLDAFLDSNPLCKGFRCNFSTSRNWN